jgi:hypothetical protein
MFPVKEINSGKPVYWFINLLPDQAMMGVRTELSDKEKDSRFKLYYDLVTAKITPEEYYRQLRSAVDPQTQVIVDLDDKELGIEIFRSFKSKGEEIGLELQQLLVEPGISTRAREFLEYLNNNIVSLRKKYKNLNLDNVRDSFAESLPKLPTLYRSLRIGKDLAEYFGKNGIKGKQVASMLWEIPTEKDFTDKNRSRWSPILIREISSFSNDVRYRVLLGGLISVSQSVTEIKKFAEDMIVGKEKQSSQEVEGFVFELNIPAIYVIGFTEEFPLITKREREEFGLSDKYVEARKGMLLQTSDGKTYPLEAPEVESFVHIPILKEYIKGYYPYKSNKGSSIVKPKTGENQAMGGEVNNTAIRGDIENEVAVQVSEAIGSGYKPMFESLKSLMSNVLHQLIRMTNIGEKSPGDLAMKAQKDKGGIDLTPANMNLQTQNAGKAIKFHLNPAQLAQLQNAPGFVPVIINIQPMNNLREFLGLNDLPTVKSG